MSLSDDLSEIEENKVWSLGIPDRLINYALKLRVKLVGYYGVESWQMYGPMTGRCRIMTPDQIKLYVQLTKEERCEYG